MQNKWNRRDAKKAQLPKMGAVGTSMVTRDQLVLDRAKQQRKVPSVPSSE